MTIEEIIKDTLENNLKSMEAAEKARKDQIKELKASNKSLTDKIAKLELRGERYNKIKEYLDGLNNNA